MSIIKFRPPRIAMVFVLVAAVLHWVVPEWGRFHTHPRFGMSLGIIGLGVMMWGWWLFKKHDVAICPCSETARLITHSIYRATRNPMYLGLTVMLIGLALYLGTLPFYLAAIAYFAVINWGFCPYEEAKLESIFGQEYLNYKARVRRWL